MVDRTKPLTGWRANSLSVGFEQHTDGWPGSGWFKQVTSFGLRRVTPTKANGGKDELQIEITIEQFYEGKSRNQMRATHASISLTPAQTMELIGGMLPDKQAGTPEQRLLKMFRPERRE